MICSCGGILLVKTIQEIPKDLSPKEKLLYNRVCDVECIACGQILYSQAYDWGNNLNLVKDTKRD